MRVRISEEFILWLMGIPAAWHYFAPSATRLSSRSRSPSSPPFWTSTTKLASEPFDHDKHSAEVEEEWIEQEIGDALFDLAIEADYGIGEEPFDLHKALEGPNAPSERIRQLLMDRRLIEPSGGNGQHLWSVTAEGRDFMEKWLDGQEWET